MLVYADTGERWRGQRINNIAHPPNIGLLWSDEQLAKIGLKKAQKAQNQQSERDLNAEVTNERDRRIADGFTFQGYSFQFRPQDKARIETWARIAGAAINNGVKANDFHWHNGSEPFVYLTGGNDPVAMDAPTMVALANAGAIHEQNMIMAARALKDQPGGPPADYANDEHWT